MSYEEAVRRIEWARRTNSPYLNLSSLELTRLPRSIGQLAALQTLNIHHNPLTELPESIGQLTALRTLSLHNNKLTSLPESIGQLTVLRELDLEYNQLTSLPESIGQLTALRELSVAFNRLTHLPESIGQLPALRMLLLNSNQLTSLPESLGQLTALRELSLYNNQLTTLPESLGNLTELRGLSLSSNQLTSLPESLGQLTALRELSLSSNQLTSLPESLGQLTELRELSLSSNQLMSLPDWLGQLGKLQILELGGNEKLGIPHAIFWLSNPKQVLGYYFRTQEGARPLNEAKLILVGRGNVGKTSLIKKLRKNQFDPSEKETTGIEIHPWQIPVCFEEVGNTTENVHLHLWDFGGQEFVHATHRFFLTDRTLYLLVLNGREGGAEPEALYWLELIQSAGEDSRVLIVLNRNAEHPFDVDRDLLREKFPIIRGFIKTDCKTGLGIEELKIAIARETALLEGVHKSFPASWYKLKDQVSSMSEAFLEFAEFRRQCAEFGIPEKDHDLLADVLNALGIALNFRRDADLQSTQVLNPRWVTGGVYAMLYSKTVREAAGIVSLQELDDILDKTDYPKRMHGFLMRLMKSFQLCFELSKDRFLLPDLLDKNQPEGMGEFKPEDCLNFEYHYSILPEGLVPRFIVRTHEMSDRQPRWRTGVVCEHNECRALVRADIQAKKIVIRIQGKESNRRFLLENIRWHFSEIHRAVKLKPEEMVPLPFHPNFAVGYEKLVGFFEDGIEAFPERVDGKTIFIDVKQLLEGVGRIRSDELRRKMIGTVNDLLESQFSTLLSILPNSPEKWFAGKQAAPAERAADLVKWAAGPGGCGLEELARHLDDIVGNRKWRDGSTRER
jgi:internalin A